MKKILITSGGTREYIDEVRVLTNISSGKLGSLIADQFSIFNGPYSVSHKCNLYEVHFVYVKGSLKPFFEGDDVILHEVTDVKSVYDIMEKLVPEMDVVIHPMAVSDFGFTPIKTKLKSNDPEGFIQSMKERIYQTPKILSHIKEWNPNCFLISFKFENELTRDELLFSAEESMKKNGSDIVIANDKSEMKKLGVHKAYVIRKEPVPTYGVYGRLDCELNGKDEIARKIFKIVNELND
jgi:phosphopantothenate-cysteine ligase